jgi:hypothetical protein
MHAAGDSLRFSEHVRRRVTPGDVIRSYRMILKRDPGDGEVQGHLSASQSLWDLIGCLVNSEELRISIIDSMATRQDVIQCYKLILRRYPEGLEVIEQRLSTPASLWDLVSRIVDSDERKKTLS